PLRPGVAVSVSFHRRGNAAKGRDLVATGGERAVLPAGLSRTSVGACRGCIRPDRELKSVCEKGQTADSDGPRPSGCINALSLGARRYSPTRGPFQDATCLRTRRAIWIPTSPGR